MSNDSEGGENKYIPKFITSKPWYHGQNDDKLEDDYLSHQRKDPKTIVDYNLAITSNGIQDEFDVNGDHKTKKNEDFDSKRDRWYGYDVNDWNTTLENWDIIREQKRAKTRKNAIDDTEKVDSDDTDYELELIELGLERDSIKQNVRESVLEKTIRDRLDIPAYIHNITHNANNKIRIEYDPKSRLAKEATSAFINDDSAFVKRDTDGYKLTQLQKFSWDINRADQQKQQKELLEKLLRINETQEPVFNLDYSIEASPTYMQLKQKQHQQALGEEQAKKKSALLDKYGPKHEEKAIDETINTSKTASTPSVIFKLALGPSHTSVFGSYFENGKWGYQCCKSLEAKSVCKRGN